MGFDAQNLRRRDENKSSSNVGMMGRRGNHDSHKMKWRLSDVNKLQRQKVESI